MPVSQGSGGYMPGMTLRAWAVVSAAGELLKSSGVSLVTKPGTGEYMLTLSGPAVAATAILKGVARTGQSMSVNGLNISGSNISFRTSEIIGGTLIDSLCHVEIYE